jgi:phage-related baseplate assembly protein
MAGRSTIDLSRLPPPDAVEVLNFETLLAANRAILLEAAPELAPVLALESEPAVKVLETMTYVPALATGADLDQLGVIVGIQRLVIDPGSPEDGVAPILEDDEAFRRRFTLAPEGFSVAGPAGAYEFHALSADGAVLDASATSPTPGEVVVTVLSRTGNGTAAPGLLAIVEDRVSAEDIRPLTDHVTVQSATIKPYEIRATIWTYAGPDTSVVMNAVQASAEAFAETNHRLGRDVNLSGVYAALTTTGVMRVDLEEPAANIICDETEAAFCTAIVLEHGGIDD